jgi:hypothetical protein
VKRQIRAKQFTADIIDTVGNRYRELVLPVPKNKSVAARIEREVKDLVTERSPLRDKIRAIPYWVQGYIKTLDEGVPEEAGAEVVEHGNSGFARALSSLRNGIFMPRYYDPVLEVDVAALNRSHELVSLSKLVRQGVLSWETGIEVGKMAYGTGDGHRTVGESQFPPVCGTENIVTSCIYKCYAEYCPLPGFVELSAALRDFAFLCGALRFFPWLSAAFRYFSLVSRRAERSKAFYYNELCSKGSVPNRSLSFLTVPDRSQSFPKWPLSFPAVPYGSVVFHPSGTTRRSKLGIDPAGCRLYSSADTMPRALGAASE